MAAISFAVTITHKIVDELEKKVGLVFGAFDGRRASRDAMPPTVRERIVKLLEKKVGIIFGAFSGSRSPALPLQVTFTKKLVNDLERRAGTICALDLAVGVDDARLQNPGANGKRATGVVDLDLCKEPQPSLDSNQRPELSRLWRSRAVGASEGGRKRRRTLSPQGRDAHFTIEHEASAMSGRSRSPRKRRRLDKDVTAVEDLTGDTVTAATEATPLEIDDSADSYENEGRVVSAKRIKPTSAEELEQPSSNIDAANPAKEQPSSSAHENARETGDSHDKKDVSKKRRAPWAAAARYKSSENCLPDYGPVHVPPPVVAKSEGTGKMGLVPGGPKPINRLSSNNGQRENKTFDLHNGYSRKADHNPNKRRRVGGESMGHTSPKDVIELDGVTAHSQNRRESSTAKSGFSHSQHGHSVKTSLGDEATVPEFNKVEALMNPSRGHDQNRKIRKTMQQNESSLDTQTTNIRSGRLSKPDGPSRATVVRLDESQGGEDPNDPISDTGLESPRRCNKSTPQVIIRSPEDTAFRGSPRSKPGTTRAGPDSTKHPTENGLKSKYFPQAHQPKRDSQRDLGQTKANTSKSHQGHQEDNVDDLSAEHYNAPRGSLGKRNRSTKSEAGQAVAIDDSSDDEITALKNGNIKPSIFPSTKKQKLGKFGEDKYEISQIFSATHIWFLGDNKKRWFLLHDRDNNSLRVEGDDAPSLGMGLVSINSIEFSEESANVVIHKSRDIGFGGATQLCLTLGDSKQSKALAKGLSGPTIKAIHKPGEYLEKVFAIARKRAETSLKPVPAQEDPADVQLAAAKIQARSDRSQEAKKSTRGPRVIDQMANGDSEPSQQARATEDTKNVKETDKPTKLTKDHPIAASDFYGGSSTTETRSSARLAGKDVSSRREPMQRTPSPERWTEQNPGWQKSWKSSIVYPREGRDKATVDKQDIERLDEGQFLNDNLIEFYIRWLERRVSKANPNLAKRIFFLNTFFYERLTTTAKGKRGINYEAVQRWTAKIDLLSYDYIVVPVNEHNHWYVAIICNAPKLLVSEPEALEHSQAGENGGTKVKTSLSSPSASSPAPASLTDPETEIPIKKASPKLKEGDSKGPEQAIDTPAEAAITAGNSSERDIQEPTISEPAIVTSDLVQAQAPKSTPSKTGKRKSIISLRKHDPEEPRIITLDSLGLKHSPTCTNLKEYLVAEIKSKRGVDIPPPGSIGMTATNIPHQDNFCDCGLFLLSYVETFVKQPDEFVRGILQNQVDLDPQWPKASDMRNRIRGLLFDLQKEQIAEAERLLQSKGTGKKGSKSDGKTGATIPAKSQSRELSTSASTSVTSDQSVPSEQVSKQSSPEQSSEGRSEGRKKKLSAPKEILDRASNHHGGQTDRNTEQSMSPESNNSNGMPPRESRDLIKDSQGSPVSQGSHDSKVRDVAKTCGSVMENLGSHGTTERDSEDMLLSADPETLQINDSQPTIVRESPSHSAESSSGEQSMKLRSPTPDEVKHPSTSRGRSRRPTPFPASPGRSSLDDDDNSRNSSSSDYDGHKGTDTNGQNGTMKDIERVEEDEMLLPNNQSSKRAVRTPTLSPRLLSDVKFSSVPSSPVTAEQYDRESRLTSASPQKYKKATKARKRLHLNEYHVDAADQAIIGKQGKQGKQNSHIFFKD